MAILTIEFPLSHLLSSTKDASQGAAVILMPIIFSNQDGVYG